MVLYRLVLYTRGIFCHVYGLVTANFLWMVAFLWLNSLVMIKFEQGHPFSDCSWVACGFKFTWGVSITFSVTLNLLVVVSMCLEAVHVFDWRLSMLFGLEAVCVFWTGGCPCCLDWRLWGHPGGRASATGRGFSCLWLLSMWTYALSPVGSLSKCSILLCMSTQRCFIRCSRSNPLCQLGSS